MEVLEEFISNANSEQDKSNQSDCRTNEEKIMHQILQDKRDSIRDEDYEVEEKNDGAVEEEHLNAKKLLYCNNLLIFQLKSRRK